jgi:RNA polymerase sigma factor (sigma-70 family)
VTPPPFQRFLDEQREPVWRFLVASVGRDHADDCFQETFLAALRAYPRLRDASNLGGWVLTIAHRKALDHHRSRGRAPQPVADVPEAVMPPSGPDLAGALDAERSWALVRALPPRQRAVLTLRFAGDLTHAHVAAALNCSEEASRQAQRDGLKALRRAMEDHR